MIEGLKFRMSSGELSNYLGERIAHHGERKDFYQRTLDKFKAGTAGDVMPQFTGGNPIDGMNAKVAEHDNKMRLFKFMRDHLVTGEEYQLSEADLLKLEIIGNARW